MSLRSPKPQQQFSYTSPLNLGADGRTGATVNLENGHDEVRPRCRPGAAFHDDPDEASLFSSASLGPVSIPHAAAFVVEATRLRQVGYRSYLTHDGHFFTDEAFVNDEEEAKFLARLSQPQDFPNEDTGLVPSGSQQAFTLDVGTRSSERLKGETLSLCSSEPSNYGSFLFRSLAKLAGRSDLTKNRRVLAPAYNDSMRDLYAMAGIAPENLVAHNTRVIYALDHAIVPSLRNAHALLDEETLAFFAQLRTRFGSRSGARRIYVSRLGWNVGHAATHRVMLNERELVERLAAAGFDIVQPHLLSIRQQIETFSAADLIVGASGSAMFNAVFSSPGTRLVDIESEPHWIAAHANLFGSCGLEYGIFEAKAADADWRVAHKPFAVNIDALMARIERLDPPAVNRGDSQELPSNSEKATDVASLERKLAEQAAQIGRLQETTLKQAAEIHNLTRNEAERATQHTAGRDGLRAELDAVYASRSWRITAPLRAIKTLGRASVGRAPAIARASARAWVEGLHFPVDRLDPARETVVVAIHEATRTGAAILGWNIVAELEKRYNVIALLNRGGPIAQAIHNIGCGAVLLPDGQALTGSIAAALASEIVKHYAPKYVVANSAETRGFVPSFERLGVPTVSLIHEFSSTVHPMGTLHELFQTGSQIVFSAQIVAESALADYYSLHARDFKVLPQGASRLPPNNDGLHAGSGESKGDLKLLPPRDGSMLVVGIGTITPRKGVEFFLAAAAAALRLNPSRKIHFAWIGKCYSFDQGYLDYLREQVKRADLGSSFSFIGEFEDLEPVYARTDIYLLSSRLDPLPNVTIDAAVRGIPTVCFDRASGMVELLRGNEMTSNLVVPYLDATAAGARIAALADSPGELARVSEAMRALATRHFDMSRYVEEIDKLGLESARLYAQLKRDEQLIAEHNVFNAGLNLGALASTMSTIEALQKYLHASKLALPRARPRTGLLMRRPMEGFHPLIYAEENRLYDEPSGEDPLAHYLRTDLPEGRWHHQVIRPESRPASQDLRVAVHGHFHYPDLLPDFLARLNRNQSVVDLLLTTTSEESAGAIARTLEQMNVKGASVQIVPNRGRDIGPLLTAYSAAQLAQYDVIGHFHGKRSPHVDATVGDTWRDFLWGHLVGDTHPMMDAILHAFAADASLGLVFAEDPHLNDWDENRLLAEGLAAKIGLPHPLPNHFDFPQGTMFWARPQALQPLLDLSLSWEDYPDEPLPIDGTLLHALERLVPFAAARAGFRYAATYVEELAR